MLLTYFYFVRYELSNRLENLEMVQQASAASFNEVTGTYLLLSLDDNNWHMK